MTPKRFAEFIPTQSGGQAVVQEFFHISKITKKVINQSVSNRLTNYEPFVIRRAIRYSLIYYIRKKINYESKIEKL